MRSPGAVLAWLVCAALAAAAAAEQDDVARISGETGSRPLYCAELSPELRVCTWHERRTRHVVCEFDGEGRRTSEPCLRLDDNESMRVFPTRPTGANRGARRSEPSREEVRAEALRLLEAVPDVRGMVRLVGAGPVWCRRGEHLTCAWHAVRRTPGYVTLARVADAPGKKIGLVCRFELDGSSGGPGSCRAEPSGAPPAPLD